MLNNTNFANRLKKIMEYYNISAASFAETIEVPRSSISHILSERNKPSLEFVLKTIETYQEVDLYWLLKGIGSFPKTASTPLQKKATPFQKSENTIAKDKSEELKAAVKPEKIKKEDRNQNQSSQIEKVLVFYKDGTFKEYKNKDS